MSAAYSIFLSPFYENKEPNSSHLWCCWALVSRTCPPPHRLPARKAAGPCGWAFT